MSKPARIQGNTYFISDNAGHIKIGKSNQDAEKRLKSIQTGNPNKLELIQVFSLSSESRAYALERAFHRYFEDYRLEGEWFKASPVKNWLDEHKEDYATAIKEEFGITINDTNPKNDTDPKNPEEPAKRKKSHKTQ